MKKLAKTKNLSFKRHWAINIEDFTPEVSLALPNTLRLAIDGAFTLTSIAIQAMFAL